MIRSLTRKEIKELRKLNLDIALLDEKDRNEKTIFKMVDWICDNVLKLSDDTEYQEAFNSAMEVYNLTYGKEAERKNS